MSWPVWVLNEANRRLQHRIDHAADDLQKKQVEVESEREAVALLRRNLAQVRHHVESRSKAATEDQRRLENDTGELQHLQQEDSRFRAEMHLLKSRQKEARELLRSISRAVQCKAEELEGERAVSETLEQRALALSAAAASQKNTHETLQDVERQKHRLERVQASLVGAHASLRASQSALQREQDEFSCVRRELEAMRVNIARGKRDKTESRLAVSHVQEAMAACEAQTLANTEAYANGMQALEAQRGLLLQLQKKHNEVLSQRHACTSMLDNRRRNEDALLARLNFFTNEAQQQESETAAMQRQLAAQRDAKRKAMLFYRNSREVRDERHVQLQQLVGRTDELHSLLKEVQVNDSRSGVQSTRPLELTRASLQRNLQQLDGRIERIRSATLMSLSEFQQEGRFAEEINHKVIKMREALIAADRDYAAHQQSREEGQTNLEALESRLSSMKIDLERIHDIMREKEKHEQTVVRGVVQELQLELHRATQRNFDLRREITPLQCALNANLKVKDEAKKTLDALTEVICQQKTEVHGMETDSVRLSKEKETALLHYAKATLELGSIRRVAESHLELMCGSASLEDILRGQALILEETVAAETKNALLQLHLEQKAYAEKQTEARRCQEQLQLLKGRWQSVMESMGRRLALTRGVKDEEVHDLSIASSPETIHARCILQSSSDREQLRERGNFLDGRIVFLEHETRTLRKMLHAMRAGGGRGVRGKQSGSAEFSKQRGGEGVGEVLLGLREGVTESRRSVQRELQSMTEVLEKLQLRRQDLSQRCKELNKELGELRALKASRESMVRRLKVQVRRRLQQKLKPR